MSDNANPLRMYRLGIWIAGVREIGNTFATIITFMFSNVRIDRNGHRSAQRVITWRQNQSSPGDNNRHHPACPGDPEVESGAKGFV
jgi:hypothetical protein